MAGGFGACSFGETAKIRWLDLDGHTELSGKDGPVCGACKANATKGTTPHLIHKLAAGDLTQFTSARNIHVQIRAGS